MIYLKTYSSLFKESIDLTDQESRMLQRAKQLITSSSNAYLKFYTNAITDSAMLYEVLREFSEQLNDNYNLTSELLGDELTEIVISFFPDYKKAKRN